MEYESNPKHSEPWQRGRKGLLCPNWVKEHARTLLDTSVQIGNKRFATMNGLAFVAQEHRPGLWHGYPEPWEKVDATLRLKWQQENKVKRKEISRYWSRELVEERILDERGGK